MILNTTWIPGLALGKLFVWGPFFGGLVPGSSYQGGKKTRWLLANKHAGCLKMIWLVVFRPTPLKNDGRIVSWDMLGWFSIPNWNGTIKFHGLKPPPTSQKLVGWWDSQWLWSLTSWVSQGKSPSNPQWFLWLMALVFPKSDVATPSSHPCDF